MVFLEDALILDQTIIPGDYHLYTPETQS